MNALAIAVVLALAERPTDVDEVPPTPGLRSDRREVVEQLARSLGRAGTGLRIVDVVDDLHGRYGAFGDIDGDGDLDYVATEMSHREERVTIHLRGNGGDWRAASSRTRPIRTKHPLQPWIVRDDGTGNVAIVLPTGWPPYFYVFATNGRGRFHGQAIDFLEALPKRSSSSNGVDDNPYKITAVVSAKDDRAARVIGTMDDVGSRSDAARHVEWEIALEDGGPVGRSNVGRAREDDVDWDCFPYCVAPPVRQPTCYDEAHVSSTRRAIMASERLDLDDDGVLDLVHFTGDFAAHVFLGVRDPTTGLVRYETELAHTYPLPIEDAWLWFWDRMDAGPDGGLAGNAPQVFTKLGFQIDVPRSGDARVVMYSLARKAFLVQYHWTGESLIPIIWYRTITPGFHLPNQNGWWQRDRVILMDDWDGEGTLDTLLVAPFAATRWTGDPPANTGSQYVDDRDVRTLEDHRYALMYLEGGAPEHERHTLFFAPQATGVPEDRHDGLPLEIERVPVFENDEVARERICLYYRPWKLGIFLEATNAPASSGERHATWMRRGEQVLAGRRHFLDCDRQLFDDDGCVSTGPRRERCNERAVWFFEQALEHASTPAERADTWHRIARCHSRLERIDPALNAFSRFVELATVDDPMRDRHGDLAWLFAQPEFREWADARGPAAEDSQHPDTASDDA